MNKICHENLSTIHTDHGESITELVSPILKNTTHNMSIARCEIAPDCASLNHLHPIVEETYHITEGTAKMIIDNQTIFLEKGDIVVIPPNSQHQIFNTGEDTLSFLAICVPAWTADCSVFC